MHSFCHDLDRVETQLEPFVGDTTPPLQPQSLSEEKIYSTYSKLLTDQLSPTHKVSRKRNKLSLRIDQIRNHKATSTERFNQTERDCLWRRHCQIQEEREKRIQKMEKDKANREILKASREEANHEYKQFMKEFKRTKPLHCIKEEQFQHNQETELESRKQKAFESLINYRKPLCFQKIRQHDIQYLKRKNTKTKSSVSAEVSSPKKEYYRGPSHQVAQEEIKQAKERYKHKQDSSLNKMKTYCHNVVNKVKEKMLKQQIRRKKAITEPVDASNTPFDGQNNRDNTKRTLKELQNNPRSHQPSIQHPQKSSLSQGRLIESTIPNERPRKLCNIKDRYDLQQLIYENEKRDRKLRQNEQLLRIRKQINMDEFLRLEDDYINSIKEKINILTGKC